VGGFCLFFFFFFGYQKIIWVIFIHIIFIFSDPGTRFLKGCVGIGIVKTLEQLI